MTVTYLPQQRVDDEKAQENFEYIESHALFHDDSGASEVLQSPTRVLSKVGEATVTWNGAGYESVNLNIKLPGAVGNCFAVATARFMQSVDDVFMRATPDGTGGINFVGNARSTTPPSGSTCIFAFIMWGT